MDSLSPAEDAEDDVVELGAGPEEEAALNGSAGNLDEGASFRDESQSPGHGGHGRGKAAANLGLGAKLLIYVSCPEKSAARRNVSRRTVSSYLAGVLAKPPAKARRYWILVRVQLLGGGA